MFSASFNQTLIPSPLPFAPFRLFLLLQTSLFVWKAGADDIMKCLASVLNFHQLIAVDV
jgi:hypothetical protein